MAQMGIGFGMKPDGTEAIIQINEGEKPLAHVTLDSSALDGVIRDLAKIRRNMAEPVPPTLDPYSRVEIEDGPGWLIPDSHNASKPGVVLTVRHAGLGWLGFLFDRESALQLAAALIKYAPKSGGPRISVPGPTKQAPTPRSSKKLA